MAPRRATAAPPRAGGPRGRWGRARDGSVRGSCVSRRSGWVMRVVLCLTAALSGILEVLFVPLYVGSVLIPVVVPLAIAGNLLLPYLGRALVPSGAGALAPVAAWLVPVLVLALFPRPEGDVLVPGGGGLQWTFYGLLLGGCAAGFVSIVLSAGPPRVAR